MKCTQLRLLPLFAPQIGSIMGIFYYGGPIKEFTKLIAFYEYDLGQIALTQVSMTVMKTSRV
jgi:hypothetical protein